MTPDAAEWVRTRVWPTELARTGYRNEHICSCQWRCPCDKGQHHYCLTPEGVPAADICIAHVYGSRFTAHVLSGILLHRQYVAQVIHLPHQKPCRLLCRCTHTRTPTPDETPQQTPPSTTSRRVRQVPVAAGQLGLFEEAS